MEEVSSAGDNVAQHLLDNKCKSSDIACIKRKELGKKTSRNITRTQLCEIIELLQKEIEIITSPAGTRPNLHSGFYEEHEIPNDDNWIPVTSGHSYKLGYSTKYATKYEKQPTVQHIGTFNCFAPLDAQCSSNSAQTYCELCTPKQTVNHVNQSNKRNNGPSNHSSRLHNLINRQGNYNINGKLASSNRVNVVNTVPKNPEIGENVLPAKVGGARNIAKKDHCIMIVGDSHSKDCATNVKSYLSNNYKVQGLVKP
jgi:hypothetical protein